MKFNFFKTEKKAVTEVDADTLVEITNANGTKVEVTVREMVNALKKNAEDDEAAAKKKKEKDDEDKKNAADKDAKEKENDLGDAEVEVDGKMIKMADLLETYRKMRAMEEYEPPEEDDQDGDLANAADDDEDEDDAKKKKAADDKKNKKNSATDHFNDLRNAHASHVTTQPLIQTGADKLKAGMERYGSK